MPFSCRPFRVCPLCNYISLSLFLSPSIYLYFPPLLRIYGHFRSCFLTSVCRIEKKNQLIILPCRRIVILSTFEESLTKVICIPESFNTNISHQLFDYIITYVNSQHQNSLSKGDFVKTGFKHYF